MNDFGRRFDPAELVDDGRGVSDAEAAGLLATARDLESFARSEQVTPRSGFEDRVMGAIATEPPPRVVAVGGGIAGIVAAIRDAWRITWSGGRPIAVRAQAFALVLMVAVSIGSLGSLATVGVLQLLSPDASPTPTPTIEPVPSPSPRPSASPTESVAPSPSPTASPTSSSSPDAIETSGAGATARPTDDNETPEPSETPEPRETPEATDDSSGPGSGSANETPEPEGTDQSGSGGSDDGD